MGIIHLGKTIPRSTRESFQHETTGHIMDIHYNPGQEPTFEIRRHISRPEHIKEVPHLKPLDRQGAQIMERLWERFDVPVAEIKDGNQSSGNRGTRRQISYTKFDLKPYGPGAATKPQTLVAHYDHGKLTSITVGFPPSDSIWYSRHAHELMQHALEHMEKHQ